MNVRPLLLIRMAAAAAVLVRAAGAVRRRPPLAATAAGTDGPTISVVIPARDEAARITPLLAALRGAPGVVEVIVVDDESSDATARIAHVSGAQVVTGAPLPRGWAGKAWALQQGLHRASGDWIVTLDADTRPSPHLAQALVSRACRDGLDFVTVAGRFECPTAGMRWLHPALLTTLIYRFGAPDSTVTPILPARRAHRHLANGQCMAFRRTDMLRAGGLGAVAGHVVEDVALARHLTGIGWNLAMVDGGALLTTRMYDTGWQTATGWARSLALPGVEPTHRQLIDLVTVIVAQALPLPRLLAHRGDLLDLCLAVVRLGTLIGTRSVYARDGRASWVYWTSPSADLAAVAALTAGIVTPHRRWRDRPHPHVANRRGGR